VRDEVRTSAQVLALLTSLELRAELFDALGDPSHSLWVERPEARPYVRELNLSKVRQMTPLLFAAYEKLDAGDFARVLKLISAISFRYTVVSGLNPSELEQAYSDAAQLLLAGEISTPREISESLRSIYVSDDRFTGDFSLLALNTNGPRKKIAKYVLCSLEANASGKHCDYETDPGTIEHILPENPTADWEASIPRNRWDEAVYRIGNLTLLDASTNRALGTTVYAERVEAYLKSQYFITKLVPELAPEEWTLPLLEARQANMAVRAKQIWRSDFAE